MKRTLSGSLEHLAPPALLRLVSATSPSGVLEIETPGGLLRLEVERGRVVVPSKEDLETAGQILNCQSGEFRFTPSEIHRLDGEVMNLTAFAEAADAAASNLRMEQLLEDDISGENDTYELVMRGASIGCNQNWRIWPDVEVTTIRHSPNITLSDNEELESEL